MSFQPPLPPWKVRALNQVVTVVYDKIFVKFADNVRPFWGESEWILFVDSEPVMSGGSQPYDITRRLSPAVQSALMRGDPYTRGYFTVSLLKGNFL